MSRMIDTLNHSIAAAGDLLIAAWRWWKNNADGSVCFEPDSGWFVSTHGTKPDQAACDNAFEAAQHPWLDTMVWRQPSWDVSSDGSLETRAFVYSLKDGHYVPGLYSSLNGGEPTICVCDEFPFPTMESARSAARELAWSEHCSTPGPVMRSPALA